MQHPAEQRRPTTSGTQDTPRGRSDSPGRLKSSDSAGRPACSTRWISSMAARKIGDVSQPVAGRHEIERRGRKRQRDHVADQKRGTAGQRGRRFGARQLDHPRASRRGRRRRAPAPQARRRCRRCRSRDRARASPGARRRQLDQPPLPPPVLSVRQHDGDEIVTIGDRRKQRAHVAAFALGRGDRDRSQRIMAFRRIISLHASVEHGRKLPEGDLSGAVGAAARTASACRWARSPRRSASRRARRRRW